jgi:hypothetical protein
MHAKNLPPMGRATRRVEVVRAAFAAVAFTLVLATGLFLLTERLQNPQAATYKGDGSDLRTGTVMLTPNGDNVCRKLAFDNQTGKMQDRGSAPCATDSSRAASDPSNRSTSHGYIDTIRESFNKR